MLGDDFKKEIGYLKKVMFKVFDKDGELFIYGFVYFFDFCKNVSVDNVFNFILFLIFFDGYFKDCKEFNNKCIVILLY